MAGMGIARFDNNEKNTSFTVIEFNLIPNLDCEEQYSTIKEELKKLNKAKNLKETFREIGEASGLEMLRINFGGISTEDTERIVNKMIAQLKSKEYPVRIYTDIIKIQKDKENKGGSESNGKNELQ